MILAFCLRKITVLNSFQLFPINEYSISYSAFGAFSRSALRKGDSMIEPQGSFVVFHMKWAIMKKVDAGINKTNNQWKTFLNLKNLLQKRQAM